MLLEQNVPSGDETLGEIFKVGERESRRMPLPVSLPLPCNSPLDFRAPTRQKRDELRWLHELQHEDYASAAGTLRILAGREPRCKLIEVCRCGEKRDAWEALKDSLAKSREGRAGDG